MPLGGDSDVTRCERGRTEVDIPSTQRTLEVAVHSLMIRRGRAADGTSRLANVTRSRFDRSELQAALSSQGLVATHDQLVDFGVSKSTITRLIAPHGRWQRLLPGVVLTHRGTPTRQELILGALAFAGEGAVITGLDALRAHGLRSVPTNRWVDLLISTHRQRKSKDYVRIERTIHLPEPLMVASLPYAPAPRAVIDACRRDESLAQVRELVAASVQNRLVSVADLREEVKTAARARTALARAVLREVGEGVRSVAEATARDVMRQFGVPAPLWNVRIFTADGVLVLSPDAFWPELGVALEIDSFAWHLGPADYLRTLQRSRQMVVNGIMVMHFAPVEIQSDPERFVREVKALLQAAGRRPAPEGIIVRPAA